MSNDGLTPAESDVEGRMGARISCGGGDIEECGSGGGEGLVPICSHRTEAIPLHAIDRGLVGVYSMSDDPRDYILQ